MSEEQLEELEVLRSIYDSRLIESVEDGLPRVRITGINEGGATVDMEISFIKHYPAEIPPFTIICTAGRIPDMESLNKYVLAEASNSVGMAMVFSLVTAVEDWLRASFRASTPTIVASNRATKNNDKLASSNSLLGDAHLTMRGGPVTRESFASWNATFMAKVRESKALQDKKLAEQTPVKLTGRELFERNKALATSDAIGEEDGDVVLDASAFEGLDDIDVEAGLEFSDQD